MRTDAFIVQGLWTLFSTAITLFTAFVVSLPILVGKGTLHCGISTCLVTELAPVIAQLQKCQRKV